MLWEAVEGSFVHGMPEAIPSFVDVVGCFGRQLFHKHSLTHPGLKTAVIDGG